MKRIKNLVYEIEMESLLNGDDLQLDYLRLLGLINSPEFIKDLIKSQLKIFVKRFYLITIIIYAALFLVLYFT